MFLIGEKKKNYLVWDLADVHGMFADNAVNIFFHFLSQDTRLSHSIIHVEGDIMINITKILRYIERSQFFCILHCSVKIVLAGFTSTSWWFYLLHGIVMARFTSS